jgi:hypothetical protein
MFWFCWIVTNCTRWMVYEENAGICWIVYIFYEYSGFMRIVHIWWIPSCFLELIVQEMQQKC